MNQNQTDRGKKPLRLPFNNNRQKSDWGTWVFRHRIGLLVTVVLYLSLAIMFVTYKIVVQEVPLETVEIEFQEVPELEEIIEDKEQEIQQIQDWQAGRVDNRISNADSKFNESLRDSKNSNAEEIYDDAERVQRELAEGQARVQREMQALENNGKKNDDNSHSNVKTKQGDRDQDAYVGGNVTVSFSLEGRTAIFLDTPAYKCLGGGQVVVNITVNQNGYVTAASVERSTSTTDNCLHREAVASAKASTFNGSMSAPSAQRGTITYIFVAQ